MIDSADILADPPRVLTTLCERLGIAWDRAMLGWARGPHSQDRIWGSHWYDKVNASTSFGPPPGPLPNLSDEYRRVADACRADYEALRAHAIC